jgi:hypothetical protein
MLALLSALVAAGCVLASARRLAWAVAPTSLEPTTLLEAFRDGRDDRWGTLRDAIASRDDLPWERDVFSAFRVGDAVARDALVHEQLMELDWRAQRWARVPRVCASIASSAGFLFASIALMRGLSLPAGDPGDRSAVTAALLSALDALAIGIAGTSFCVAVHLRARRAVRDRVAAAGRLVDRLRSLAESRAFPGAAGRVT